MISAVWWTLQLLQWCVNFNSGRSSVNTYELSSLRYDLIRFESYINLLTTQCLLKFHDISHQTQILNTIAIYNRGRVILKCFRTNGPWCIMTALTCGGWAPGVGAQPPPILHNTHTKSPGGSDPAGPGGLRETTSLYPIRSLVPINKNKQFMPFFTRTRSPWELLWAYSSLSSKSISNQCLHG